MFQKATRKKVKLKLAITGPGGSGKTEAALKIAKQLGGKTAVIDTENGSASLYADRYDFDTCDITPPFTHDKYVAAINFAEKNGYANIIIDSGSHAWAGEGGLLEQKNALDSKPNTNHFTNWAPITKKHNEFNNSFLHSSCHVIMTLRSKTETVLQTDDKGKTKPVKLGMAPIARDGVEYEFSVVFDLDLTHGASVSKDRTGLFDGKYGPITEETGKLLKDWLESGAEPAPVIKFDLSPEVAKLAAQPIKKEDHVLTLGLNKGKTLGVLGPSMLYDFIMKMRSQNMVNDKNFKEVELIEAFILETGWMPPVDPPVGYKDDTLD